MHDFGFFLLIFRQGAPRSGKELKYNSGLVEYRVQKINSEIADVVANDAAKSSSPALAKISKINTNKDLALTDEETIQLQKKKTF